MNIPILMYHQIDAPPRRGTPLRGLVVSPASFARQMSWLKLLGYQGLSMTGLEPYLQGERIGRVVGITFDDGYQNNIQHALPILLKNRFTATCYGVSSMIGGTNSWDLNLGVSQKPLMNAGEWGRWRDSGMDIGSHTCIHADLLQVGPDSACAQIADSKLDLEREFRCEVRHFCYPYGRFDPVHCEMVQRAGYATATTTRRGRVAPGSDPYTLRRIMVAQATTLAHFTLKILTAYEDRRG